MTAQSALQAYEQDLYGCRFCPMCKPAGEVSNFTQLESHTTRARAMSLWRIATGLADWGPREIEILYQSTLDSLSEAFCISHYAVSGYMAAARADVFAAGLAPASVRAALSRPPLETSAAQGPVVLLGSEAVELGDAAALVPARRALAQAGIDASLLLLPSGALAYALGARAQARAELETAMTALVQGGARRVIADGPQTLWALSCLYARLGVTRPTGLQITSLTGALLAANAQGKLRLRDFSGQSILFHDCRASAQMADKMAVAETVQPGYRGEERKLGQGAIYDEPRRLVAVTGAEMVFTTWSRSLAKSCGADDGLWLTYPDLAQGLRGRRVAEARRLGARAILTDSLLSAAYLKEQGENGLPVYWLPELIETGAAA